MTIFDLFSKRAKRDAKSLPDPFVYDQLPQALRVQVVLVLQDTLGKMDHPLCGSHYAELHDAISRERGRFHLGEHPPRDDAEKGIDFANHLLACRAVDEALDCVELAFRLAHIVHDDPDRIYGLGLTPFPVAVEELNGRFREHSVGYEFNGHSIIRVDSQLLHEEAVRPAIHVLSGKGYETAETEFLRGFEHYRHKRFEEALVDAAKSLESVLKIVCQRRKWPYKQTDTARTLLTIVFDQGLVPPYMQSQFAALRATLESGVPTLRNKLGAHGAGAVPRHLDRHLVAYALQTTASAILFLAECDRLLK